MSSPDLTCHESLESILDVFEYDELPGQTSNTQIFPMSDGFVQTIKGHHNVPSMMFNTPEVNAAGTSRRVERDENDGPSIFDTTNTIKAHLQQHAVTSTPKKVKTSLNWKLGLYCNDRVARLGRCMRVNCMCECEGDQCDTSNVEDHCNESKLIDSQVNRFKNTGATYAAQPRSGLEQLSAAYALRKKVKQNILSPLSDSAPSTLLYMQKTKLLVSVKC